MFPDLLGLGGVQEAGRLTALALQKITERRGWSVSFISLNDCAGERQFVVDGRTILVKGFSRAKAQFVFAVVRAARTGRRSVAHIVLAAHPYLAPLAVFMQKVFPRTHAVVIAHGVEVWQPLPFARQAAIRKARMVAGPSADTIRKLVEIQRVASSRTRLLPWPLNPDFLRLTDSADLPMPSGFPDGKVILTIGRAAASEQYKGADDLIRAIAQLRPQFPDLHLVAVGGGDDLTRLQKLANELGASRSVLFLRHLSREQLAACYGRADVFAMPSAGEGFGLVFLEAMAFGKPLVAAACGGALDLIQEDVNGLLVPPRDSSAIRTALRRLLQDESLRTRLGARGLAIVREKYNFESFETNLERLLEECAVRG